jgi:hypothetical protein
VLQPDPDISHIPIASQAHTLHNHPIIQSHKCISTYPIPLLPPNLNAIKTTKQKNADAPKCPGGIPTRTYIHPGVDITATREGNGRLKIIYVIERVVTVVASIRTRKVEIEDLEQIQRRTNEPYSLSMMMLLAFARTPSYSPEMRRPPLPRSLSLARTTLTLSPY